ncbi:MAG TPA: hypothetical protein VGW40_09610 [Allosphingosinicella sp.]|nr:hypothetical protein [Allosphingosinicella sp.]
MASVLDVFPRRPIRLAPDGRRRRNRILLLVATLLLALPACYWGYQSWHGATLRADLRARGVRAAETLGAKGDCTSRRSRLSGTERPIDCWFDVSYRLRPEEGGALRQARVHHEGRAPIFTPAAIYDPADPDRVMLEPELEREMSWSELLGPALLLLLPAATLLVFFLTSRRGLARAAQKPEPLIVPIEKAIRQPGRLYLHTRAPGAARPAVDSFPDPLLPLLVPAPPGEPADRDWALALKAPNGRHYVLDSALAWLDLTDAERGRVLQAARG